MQPLHGDGCEGLGTEDTAACRECHERTPTSPDKVWTWVIRPDGSMICSEILRSALPPPDVERPDLRPMMRPKKTGQWIFPVAAGFGALLLVAIVASDD